jgi:hypothetical protein
VGRAATAEQGRQADWGATVVLELMAEMAVMAGLA